MALHIRVDTSNVSEYLAKFGSNLQRKTVEAMRISLRDVRERARKNHRFTTRTGDAERSIDASDVKVNGTSVSGEVGTTREITVYLHQGTKPHDILPRKKTVLRWNNGSEFIFARRVHHPGTKEDPFIFNAIDVEEPTIVSRFDHIIDSL